MTVLLNVLYNTCIHVWWGIDRLCVPKWKMVQKRLRTAALVYFEAVWFCPVLTRFCPLPRPKQVLNGQNPTL